MIHNITRHGYHRIPYGKYTIQSLLSMRLRKKSMPTLTWVVWAPCTMGLVPGDTQCWPGACPTDGISIGVGFLSGFGVLWFGAWPIVGWFAHVATVPLSWRVRNFVMIGGVRFEPERGRFWSGFGFGRDIVFGTGVRTVKSAHLRQFSWPKYFFILFSFRISVVRLLYYVMSRWQ